MAIIRIIVSAVMDVETHTAKHEQQKCDHVYIHTPYTRAFFHTINLQSAGCGQARGVSPRRNAAAERYSSVPPRASPEVPVWRSAFPKSAGMAFRCVPAQFKHCTYIAVFLCGVRWRHNRAPNLEPRFYGQFHTSLMKDSVANYAWIWTLFTCVLEEEMHFVTH